MHTGPAWVGKEYSEMCVLWRRGEMGICVKETERGRAERREKKRQTDRLEDIFIRSELFLAITMFPALGLTVIPGECQHP